MTSKQSFRDFVRENRDIIARMLRAGKFTEQQRELLLLADPELEKEVEQK